MNDYKIDEKGIYYTRNSYHNEVDTVYIVDLTSENSNDQLTYFIKYIKDTGAQERSEQIGRLLGVAK